MKDTSTELLATLIERDVVATSRLLSKDLTPPMVSAIVDDLYPDAEIVYNGKETLTEAILRHSKAVQKEE